MEVRVPEGGRDCKKENENTTMKRIVSKWVQEKERKYEQKRDVRV